MSRQTQYFSFKGGENHSDPALSIPPGDVIASLNYELSPDGGYHRVDGFERYDGQPKPSDALLFDYADEAAWITEMEARRTAIGAVPGEGDILGVWQFLGKTYAFRNKVGGASAGMYRSDVTGWIEVDLGTHLNFVSGSQEIFVGDTINGQTSGATLVVTQIEVFSGTWGTNDAAGEIHYASVTGGPFQDGENIRVAAVIHAIADTPAVSTHTLSPGGRYEFENHNFYGHTSSLTMYGVNGVDRGFHFDGSFFSFIHTGMTIDTPNHLIVHKNHLFYSFPGGSIQHSSLGEPVIWDAITGAAELALGDECSGFALGTKDALGIWTRNQTFLLYGTSVANWNLSEFSDESGAVPGSIQRLGQPIYLDDRGVATLTTVDAYGDFNSNSISKKMDEIIKGLRSQVTTSIKVREKDQYRLYFADSTCMSFTFVEGKLTGIMRHDYGIPVLTACSSEDADGNEVMLFGSDDGYVYQIDSGPSFDGEVVNAWVRPAFNHFKSPENRKRFFKAVLEIEARGNSTLYYIPNFDYGGENIPAAIEGEMDVIGGGGFWDVAIWDEFFYDAQVIGSAFGYIDGIGKNFSLYIRSADQYENPHTLQGVIIHFSLKGLAK